MDKRLIINFFSAILPAGKACGQMIMSVTLINKAKDKMGELNDV